MVCMDLMTFVYNVLGCLSAADSRHPADHTFGEAHHYESVYCVSREIPLSLHTSGPRGIGLLIPLGCKF